MIPPETVPTAVTEGLQRYAGQHEGETLQALLADLKWDSMMRCYYFWRHGMFHGVELDGHVHT
jgi:hypothetical protein